MEVTAEYQGRAKFTVSARGHTVTCDQPRENGGADEGMTPPEFFLASLATCAGYYAAQYLNARGLPSAGLSLRLHAEKLLKPARLGALRIEVDAPDLPAMHTEGLLRSVKACLIHNTILSAPSIDVAINTHTLPAAA